MLLNASTGINYGHKIWYKAVEKQTWRNLIFKRNYTRPVKLYAQCAKGKIVQLIQKYFSEMHSIPVRKTLCLWTPHFRDGYVSEKFMEYCICDLSICLKVRFSQRHSSLI